MEELDRIEKIEKLKRIKKEIKYHRSERNTTVFHNIIKGTVICAPVCIIGGILASSYVINKNIPFHIDDIKNHAYNKLTYSSTTGLLDKKTEYTTKTAKDDDIMVYYGPWVQQDDGTYISSVKEYTLNDISEKDLEELVNKEDLSFEDIFNLSFKNCKESIYKKDSVSEEELEIGSHYEIKVYDYDMNDTVMLKETKDDISRDVAKFFLSIAGVTFSEALLFGVWCDDLIPDTIKYETEKINEYKIKKKEIEKELGK
jgi:hypothetical protein